jgi:CRISPR-associated protein Cmr6
MMMIKEEQMQACRDVIFQLDLKQPKIAHADLLLDRYLKKSKEADNGEDQKQKRELLEAACRAVAAAPSLYEHCFNRWRSCLPQWPPPIELSVNGRMIIGLGSESVLETGIALHHTYGTPVIPGSALKGLAAHYCSQVWGEADREFQTKHEYHKTLFGDTDDSGHIIFYDAWIDPASLSGCSDSGLVLDVMTPHHRDYYAGMEAAAPTDFDDPNPILFLSVTGRFHIALACDVPDDEGCKWAKLALDLLKEALENWGIGGKTSSGYGRLSARSNTYQESKSAGSLSARRNPGTDVVVKVIGPRAKGKGLRVQEAGRSEGSLTVGDPPAPMPVEGEEISVLVHIDDAHHPQYKWKAAQDQKDRQKQRAGQENRSERTRQS